MGWFPKCCCNEGPCCCGASDWDSVVIDVGSAFWMEAESTALGCEHCEDFAGELTLAKASACSYRLRIDYQCFPGLAGAYRWEITFTFDSFDSSPPIAACSATVHISFGRIFGADDTCELSRLASYTVTLGDQDEVNCNDYGAENPLTLDRYVNSDAECPEGTHLCTGDAPLTIAAWGV